MTAEERLHELEQENRLLREQLDHRDELIAQLHLRLHQQEERIAKISHNTHLPPSSDRFVQQLKSPRQKSGKKLGGQQSHVGTILLRKANIDEVIVHLEVLYPI